MGWFFFGCFGRRNKDPRSAHHGDQNLLLPQPLPFSSPSPSQPPPIPIKTLNPSKEQGSLRTRPLATSAPPVRAGYDVLVQENAKNVLTKKGARKKAEDPWSQVDDLAEELEDLRKQIEKGTTTARESCNNQITEEVTFLKSCGALPQSPVDLEKKDEETLSVSSYSKGWHSWLLPLSSNPSPGPAKPLLIGKKNVSARGLQVASSSSTPAKQKGSGIIHRRNEISKDNLQIGSVVASEHTDPQTQEDGNMDFIMSTPTSHKHLKNVSGNPSALTKQIEEHKRHISFMNESFSTGNVRTTSSKSIELLKASQSPADQVISPALIPLHTQGEADEVIQSLEQHHDLCDSVGSKQGTSGFVSSPAIGNHRYAAVDSAVSASQILSDSSSCSTTAENSCESPSGSISSSFDADSCCIKSNESHLRSGRIVSLSKDCEGTQRDLNQYRRLTWEDSATSSTIGVASTPNQKNGWRKYATSVLPNDRRYAMDEDNIENSFLDAKHLSGRNIEASSKCIDSDALSPQQTKQVSMQSATTAHRELTPMACLKPQRIRNQPQSPVLTPVENEFQWKKLQEKGNQRMKSVDPVASLVTSWKSTDAAAAKTSLKTINPTVPTKRDVLGSIDNNNIVSGTAAVVSVTASFSEWSKPVPMEDEEYRKRIQHDETFRKDSIAVDMSLSHWLNPTPPLSSIHDGGLGCTPRNGLPRPLPLPAIQPEGSPKFSQSERPILIQPSPMLGPNERPVSGQLSPKCSRQFERPNSGCFSGYRQLNNSATPKLHWDGLGIPNTTTKYNEDQMVKWFSSPFEVRLERELDKQKDGLQKRLFGRPT